MLHRDSRERLANLLGDDLLLQRVESALPFGVTYYIDQIIQTQEPAFMSTTFEVSVRSEGGDTMRVSVTVGLEGLEQRERPHPRSSRFLADAIARWRAQAMPVSPSRQEWTDWSPALELGEITARAIPFPGNLNGRRDFDYSQFASFAFITDKYPFPMFLLSDRNSPESGYVKMAYSPRVVGDKCNWFADEVIIPIVQQGESKGCYGFTESFYSGIVRLRPSIAECLARAYEKLNAVDPVARIDVIISIADYKKIGTLVRMLFNMQGVTAINSIGATVPVRIDAVYVKDPTHGTKHLIPVPSNIESAKDAVAWSFGLEEFQPVIHV